MSNILRFINFSLCGNIPIQKVLRSDLQYVNFQKFRLRYELLNVS